MEHTSELIKEATKSVIDWPTEQIAHEYKCALSKQLAKEKKLYDPFVKACEKELRKRARPITKPVALDKPTKEGKASDMYEDE